MLVLLADDDEDLRAIVAEQLRTDGHDVIEACDGADLLDRLDEAVVKRKKLPALIISDVLMPKLSASGCCRCFAMADLRMRVRALSPAGLTGAPASAELWRHGPA